MASIVVRHHTTVPWKALRARRETDDAQAGSVRRSLHASLWDGVGWGGMVGLGETYLPAFALAVGLGELTAGLVASVPLLAGGVMQTISPTAIRFLKSHKRWVVACATLQALSFAPLLIAAVRGSISSWALLAIAALYWGGGLATGPAWNTWVGTLVPRPLRPRFFATRTRLSQAAVFAGFLVAGIGLQYAATHDVVTIAFAVIFAVAGLCRLGSVAALWQQAEPFPVPHDMKHLSWPAMWQRLQQHNGGRLLLYLVAVQAAVQFSGPYFTPFMFKTLQFSYASYVILISVAYLAKVLSLPLWGRTAHRLGAHRLLWIGGVGIIPLSAGWIISQHMAWLLVLQLVGGIAWGAYELAFFLLFFESIEQDERTSMLTLYNLLNATAWVSGALAGGFLLYWYGTSPHCYMLLFGCSSLARLAALLLLARVRPQQVETREICVRPVSVRPNANSWDAPVLSSIPAPAPGKDDCEAVAP